MRAARTRYVDDGSIEIDNNAAEHAIRALVLGRRNYLFAAPTLAARRRRGSTASSPPAA